MSTQAARTRAKVLSLAALLVASIALASCGGTAATTPANTLELSPAAPTAAPSPSPTPSPTASPSPTPDLTAQAARAYLALATRVNAEVAALAPLPATPTLAEIKAHYTRLAELQGEGITGVQAITFPPRLRDDVENLIRAAKALQVVEANIAAAATLAEVSARQGSLNSAYEAMTRAANNLRQDLGLPPTATPIPPPTLAPTASPSGALAGDPTAGLRIGAPYALKPVDATTVVQVQAQMRAALGSLADAFRFGFRLVTENGEELAAVMVMEVPGISSEVLASPGFLDSVATNIGGGSSANIVETTIEGRPARLVDRLGAPIVLYVHDESVVVVIGQPGSSLEDVTAIATALIKAEI